MKEKGRKEERRTWKKEKNEKKKFVEKNQKITLTPNISSTLRGSPRTEFHQKTQCIRKVMVILT